PLTIATALWAAASLAPSLASAIPPGDDGLRLRDAAIALDELRVEEAEPVIEALATTYPDDPEVRWERAMLRFVRGDYAGAARDGAASMVRANRLRSARERVEIYRLMWATREVTRRQIERRSQDGRYVVRFSPGPDHVLADYAIETMRAAD